MKDIDEKYSQKVYMNLIKAIVIMLYFFILNVSYQNVNPVTLEKGIQFFTMIFLFIAIFLFEKAYKKDDGELAICAIELMVLATYTLTTKYITTKFKFDFNTYSLVASYFFSIYFVLRSIIEYTKGQREIVKNLSDIKEIVKKEAPVVKEAKKKSKIKDELKKDNKEDSKEKSNENNKKANPEKENNKEVKKKAKKSKKEGNEND